MSEEEVSSPSSLKCLILTFHTNGQGSFTWVTPFNAVSLTFYIYTISAIAVVIPLHERQESDKWHYFAE